VQSLAGRVRHCEQPEARQGVHPGADCGPSFPLTHSEVHGMDIKQAIISGLGQADSIVDAYLADLTPAELLVRPAPGANHLAWQLGHLIASERYLVDKAAPGAPAALPAGFAERHTKQTAGSDRAEDFLTKDEYLRVGKATRADTLRVVEGLAPEAF